MSSAYYDPAMAGIHAASSSSFFQGRARVVRPFQRPLTKQDINMQGAAVFQLSHPADCFELRRGACIPSSASSIQRRRDQPMPVCRRGRPVTQSAHLASPITIVVIVGSAGLCHTRWNATPLCYRTTLSLPTYDPSSPARHAPSTQPMASPCCHTAAMGGCTEFAAR